MKLWLISQTKNSDYDTYDAAVVCAETEDEANNIRPSGGGGDIAKYESQVWVTSAEDVKCEYLGESAAGLTKGVVLASFNAG